MEKIPAREASEHIKLLRKAARTRLVVLVVFSAMTLGLWAALQAGDQKAAKIDRAYEGRLAELRKKWEIPDDVKFDYYADDMDISQDLIRHGYAAKDIMRLVKFQMELDQQRAEYFAELETAYIIPVKFPYFQEPSHIDGITIANCWPFALVSIVASCFVFSMREKVNAVIVAWISHRQKDHTEAHGLVVKSDFAVGKLSERGSASHPYVVYRRPLTIHPESILIYALILITIYLSYSFGFFQNPANTDAMESVLFDYVAALWLFVLVLGKLVLVTRSRYRETLEKYVGMPVKGWLSDSTARATNGLRLKVRHFLSERRWLRLIMSAWLPLTAVAAIAALALPWMTLHELRGYRFLFRGGDHSPLGDYLFLELRIQAWFATLFIVFVVIVWLLRTLFPTNHFTRWLAIQRVWAIMVLALITNLVFHFAVLEVLSLAESQYLFNIQWNILARPHIVKNSVLIFADPEIGFWLFGVFCALLAFTSCVRSTQKAHSTQVHAHEVS